MSGPRSRVGSASTLRTGSASRENQHLRDTIETLKQELMHKQAENAKVQDQLNCLILLVKRAWTGDKDAAKHVANIVGVAPPDLQEEDAGDLRVTLTAKPKSRALNNWAVLTIGVLNREYRQIENEMEERGRMYLQHRKDFLDEQLLYHRHLKALRPSTRQRHNSWADDNEEEDIIQRFAVRPGSQHTQVQNSNQVQSWSLTEKPTSAGLKRKPPTKHLYKEPSRNKSDMKDVTLADLLIEPTHNIQKSSNQVFDGLYRLTSATNGGHVHEEEEDLDRTEISYDNPRRYSQSGLFDLDAVFGADRGQAKKRPVSAVQQRQSDAMRARPKSSVLPRGERPLKYETTRPISAQVNNKLRGDMPVKVHNGRPPSQKQKKTTNAVYPEDRKKEEREEAESKPNENQPPMQIRVSSAKQASNIKQFVEDMRQMNQLEDDFRSTALMLQKKLGISDEGMIY